jgi:phosphoribosylamine--glycine ligase
MLPRLKSDLLTALVAARDGMLKEIDLRWSDKTALTVVMASKGYPGSYAKGQPISGLEEAARLPGVQIFHAGTALKDGKIVANGGRVLDVTALGKNVTEAQARAYAAVDLIHWDGCFARRDIGWRAVARERA